MSRRTLAPAVLLALAGALVAAGAVALLYDVGGGLQALAILAPLGVATVLAASVLVDRRARLGGLRRQAAALAVLAAAQLGAAVLGFIAVMFISGHDGVLTVLVVLYGGAIAAWAVRLVARGAMADLDAVRGTLAAVGDGRRDVRTAVQGGGELAQLAAEVDRMVMRLDAEETARRGMMAAVSHDLRTPITSLRLLAEAIDDEIVPAAERREYVARMGTHLRALGVLIDDLFELTRLERREVAIDGRPVMLDALVREAVEAMRPQATARMVDVRAEVPEVLMAARGEPDQLLRVLFNLMQNAIRHTPADGHVVVRAEGVQGGVEVEVQDTGTGIAAADRAHVFEPFYRGDAARGADAGSGLGLAISRAIVEAHGGRIWLGPSEPGTRVRFRLPLADPEWA